MSTTKIKASIIDDELHCLESLQALIKKYCPTIEILEVYSSSKAGLLGLRQNPPDILFLDVEMPWMNGIEMLKAMGDVKFKVIFTTAHNQYAVQAFRLSAIDYLLKPINQKDLSEAVSRISLEDTNMNEGIQHLTYNLENPEIRHRVAIPSRDGLDFILIENIIYCEADSNYTHIYLMNDKHIIMSKPLKDLDLQLRPYNFCRIHHSYLINLNHLIKYIRGNAGYVVLVNNKSLNVSRAKKQELLSKLGYQFPG